MNTPMKTFIAAILVAGTLSTQAQTEGQWIGLFNGQNLDGWTV